MLDNVAERLIDVLYTDKRLNRKEKVLLSICKDTYKKRVDSILNIRRMLVGRIKSIEIKKDEVAIKLDDGLLFNWKLESFYSTNLASLIRNGLNDPEEELVIRQILKKGDSVLDIGANWGWYTLLFSKLVGENGAVYSFEPIQSTFGYLAELVQLNELANVVLNCSAVSDFGGIAPIFIPGEGYSMASLNKHFDMEHQVYECEVKMLDGYAAEKHIERINLIKVDAEGSELSVLKGARNILSRDKPFLIMEFNEKFMNDFGYASKDIIRFLREYKYRLFNIVNGKLKEFLNDDEQQGQNVICFNEENIPDLVL